MMAVRPRVASGFVDLGDQKVLVEEVTEENVELYNLTYSTMIEAFTEPLSPQEVEDITNRLQLEAIAALVEVDPDAATSVLRSKREAL